MDNIPISKDARKLAFIGAGLFGIGTLLPIVSVPIIGSMTLFSMGGGYGLIAILIAAGAAALAYSNQTQHVLWAGIAAAIGLLWGLIRYMSLKSEMREQFGGGDQNNPFSSLADGIVDSVQLQWGWIALAAGAGVLIYSGWLARKSENSAEATDSTTGTED